MWEKTHCVLRWSERYTKTDMVEFATNNTWLFIGRIIAVVGGMVLTVAFANLLSPTAFGTYKYILAMAGFVGGLSIMGGLGASTTRTVAQGHKEVIPRVFWLSVLGNVPAFVLSISIAGYYFYMENPTLGTGMVFVAVTSLFGTSFGLYKSLMTGLNDFRGLSLYSIPASLIAPALIVGTLFVTQNLIAIFAAYFLGSFLFGLVMYVLALRRAGVAKGAMPDSAALSEAKRYGFHLTIIGMIIPFVAQADQLLLWHFVGPVELAVFAFAIAPIREIKALLENFAPMMAVRYANRTPEELRASIPLRSKQLFTIAAILAGLYVLVAPLLFTYLFPQYMSALFLSQLLALTILVQPARNVLDSAITAQAKTKYYYFLTATMQTIKLGLSVALIPTFGLAGAIAGLIIHDIAAAIIYIFTFRRAYMR